MKALASSQQAFAAFEILFEIVGIVSGAPTHQGSQRTCAALGPGPLKELFVHFPTVRCHQDVEPFPIHCFAGGCPFHYTSKASVVAQENLSANVVFYGHLGTLR